MPFLIVLSPEAIEDNDTGFNYYNKLSEGLGFEFTDTIDMYLKKSVSGQQLLLSAMIL